MPVIIPDAILLLEETLIYREWIGYPSAFIGILPKMPARFLSPSAVNLTGKAIPSRT